MRRAATLYLTVASIDAGARTIEFMVGEEPETLDAAGGFERVAACLQELRDDPIEEMGHLHEIGVVRSVEIDDAAERVYVTAKVHDKQVWAKVDKGVYRGARLTFYGSGARDSTVGRLTLSDRPEPSDKVLRGARAGALAASNADVAAVVDRAHAAIRRADRTLSALSAAAEPRGAPMLRSVK